jgi:hypothetical protein
MTVVSTLYDEDILAREWRERLAKLPERTQRLLEEYKKNPDHSGELIPVKRGRPRLSPGDVFVVQPREGLYFYGRVLNTDVSVRFRGGPRVMWTGVFVICIYRCSTTRLTLDDFKPSYDDLLVAPSLVIKQGFTLGYFYKLGNVPLSEEEREELDYGFFNSVFYHISDEYGNILDYRPKLLSTGSLGSFNAIAYEITREIIIDPSLLRLDLDTNAGAQRTRFAGASDDDRQKTERSSL